MITPHFTDNKIDLSKAQDSLFCLSSKLLIDTYVSILIIPKLVDTSNVDFLISQKEKKLLYFFFYF